MNLEEVYQRYLFCSQVSTDTRSIEKDDLFVALKGPSFDGNKYAQAALEKGAKYALVDDPNLNDDERYILVKDALKTLQSLASYRRGLMDIPVLGITGSNGKTTTKELLIAALSTHFSVAATRGNYNNHIGVPLTILNADQDASFLIVEMGTNQPGDIAELCSFADPNFGLITNIGASHLERLGSIEGVFNDKRALFDHVSQNKGIFFLNEGDEYISRLKDTTEQIVTYSSSTGSFGRLVKANETDQQNLLSVSLRKGEKEVTIKTFLSGGYNMENVAAALEVGLYFGIPLEKLSKSISTYRPNNMRSQVIHSDRNAIILDAYNANPSSMCLSIKSIVEQNEPANLLLIIGDMFELGESAQKEHLQVIELLSSLGLEDVFLVGKNFESLEHKKYPVYPDTQSLIQSGMLEHICGKTILVKGSRGVKLEGVLNQL